MEQQTHPATASIPLSVYDIGAQITASPHLAGLRPFTTEDDELAILEGPEGVLVISREGITYRFASIEETFEITLVRTTPGQIPMAPEGSIFPRLRELADPEHCRQVPLPEHIRRFGSRLERNYTAARQEIRGIGLDPDAYGPPRR